MHDIFMQGIAMNQRKKKYDAICMIEVEKNRRAHERLHKYKRQIDHMWLDLQAWEAELYKREREESTCPNYGFKRIRVQTRPIQLFWELVRNVPPGSSGSRQGNESGVENAIRSIKEVNEAIRARLQERMRERLTGVMGFISPLLRPIGLLDNEVREGRRLWALTSPFLDPPCGRNTISLFPVPSHLQQYYLGTWEDWVIVKLSCLDCDFIRQPFWSCVGLRRFLEGHIWPLEGSKGDLKEYSDLDWMKRFEFTYGLWRGHGDSCAYMSDTFVVWSSSFWTLVWTLCC